MPKLIVKSGYTKDIKHFVNNLEYSGNKIGSQQIVLNNGERINYDNCKVIDLDEVGREKISSIYITFKDGKKVTVSTKAYEEKTRLQKNVTVERIIDVIPDNDNVKEKQPRELQELNFFKYMSYVGERPGVVKDNGLGLFSLNGDIMPSVAEDIAQHDKFKRGWMHIISMDKADAQRTGFNTREAWRDLAISKAPEMAKAYNISLENLRFYGGFHLNTDNPHVHINFYSADSTEGFVKDMGKASKKVKSLFTNAIFKDDIEEIKKSIGIAKSEMSQALSKVLAMNEVKQEYVDRLQEIAKILPLKGKMQYQFAPPQVKDKIKDFLRSLLLDEALEPLFQGYLKGYELYAQIYADNPEVINRQKASAAESLINATDKNAWRRLHNEIMQAAVAIRNINNEAPVINNTNRAPVGYAPNAEIKSPKEQGDNPFAAPGTYISTFAQYLPDYYIKQLAGNECKEATTELYKVISNTIKDKIVAEPSFALEMQQGYLDLSQGKEISIDSLSSQIFSINSEAALQKENWLAAIKESIAKIVPADMQMHVVEMLDKYINTANRTLPFNNTIYYSIANLPETVAACVLKDNPAYEDFKKKVSSVIVSSIRDGQRRKGDKTIPDMLKTLKSASEEATSDIKMQLTGIIKDSPDVAVAMASLEADFIDKFTKLSSVELPQKLFEQTVLYDGFQSVNSTVDYYSSQFNILDTFFREQRIQDAVLHMIKGVAQGLFSELSNKETDLSHSESNLTGQGDFTRKQGLLSARKSHGRIDLNW